MTDDNIKTVFPDTWEGIRDRAIALRTLFAHSGVRLPARSDLASHIDGTIEYINARERGFPADVSDEQMRRVVDQLFRAWQLSKIADALLSIEDAANRVKYMRALASGGLGAFTRRRSQARDFLSELVLYKNLRKLRVAALLQEPDIVVTLAGVEVGIACKKIYSDTNISATLSRAVKQIERRHEFGIVALDIEDLIGREHPDQWRVFTSTQQMQILLVMECRTFQQRHAQYFEKYLQASRVMGVLVSNGGTVQCEGKPINAHAMSVWAWPHLPPQKQQVMESLRSLIEPELVWVPDIVVTEWKPPS